MKKLDFPFRRDERNAAAEVRWPDEKTITVGEASQRSFTRVPLKLRWLARFRFTSLAQLPCSRPDPRYIYAATVAGYFCTNNEWSMNFIKSLGSTIFHIAMQSNVTLAEKVHQPGNGITIKEQFAYSCQAAQLVLPVSAVNDDNIDDLVRFAKEAGDPYPLTYDNVIIALGWHQDLSLYDDTIKPTMMPNQKVSTHALHRFSPPLSVCLSLSDRLCVIKVRCDGSRVPVYQRPGALLRGRPGARQGLQALRRWLHPRLPLHREGTTPHAGG